MNASWNLPPGCTPQDIDDAMGPEVCDICEGSCESRVWDDKAGEYIISACPGCDGTGNAPTRAELRAQREEERADLERDLRKDEE